MEAMRSTTILVVRRNNTVAMAGDGQATLGNMVAKSHTRKVRRLGGDKVLTGFAGSTADAMVLLDLLDESLTTYNNNLMRAAVELAKKWRKDKYLQRLEATILCADKDLTLQITGAGDLFSPDPDADVMATGSGAGFALAAARALLANTDLDAESIARKSLEIAADICIYTNHNIICETIETGKNS